MLTVTIAPYLSKHDADSLKSPQNKISCLSKCSDSAPLDKF